jgi:hypothetical protein
MRRLILGILITSLALTIACEVSNAAEPVKEGRPFYVGVFGGYSFPENVSFTGEGILQGLSFSDASMKNGWNGGLKLGWVLPTPSYEGWLSWEFEYWYQNLGIKQQTLTITSIGGGQAQVTGSKMDVHTFASNIVFRRPTGVIRPYVGVGPSLVYVDLRDGPPLGNGTRSAAGFGINLLAGTRIMFTQYFGMFAEYKHNRAFDLKLNDVSFNLNSNAVVGGLVWDFDAFSLP